VADLPPPPPGYELDSLPPPPAGYSVEETGQSEGGRSFLSRLAGKTGDQLSSAASNFWHKGVAPFIPGTEDATRAGQGMLDLVSTNPVKTGKSYLQGMADIGGQVGTAAKEGRYGEALARLPGFLTSAVPGVGAPYNEAVTQAISGDPGGSVGTVASMVGNFLLGSKGPKLAEGMLNVPTRLRGMIAPNVNNPVQESALQWAENQKIPMSVGQRSGQAGIQRVEQGLENAPGASTKAQTFYRNQQDAIAKTGDRIAQQVSPTTTNEYGAAQAINQRLQQRIARIKSQSDNLYDQVRAGAAKNQQSVQVGTQTSPVVGPNGQPLTTPVMQVLDSPIDLNVQRAQLQPIWDDINRLMPEARKASSPAYSALKDLMGSKDSQMSAMDFDKFLGAVKAISRDGASPYLTNQSQALARKIITGGEQQLTQALAKADPTIPATLKSARNTVRAYYSTADLLDDINNVNQEPGVLFDNLTRGGDRVVNTLKDLSKVAPKELSTVGRVFIEDLLNKATKEGGFKRAPGMLQAWDRLGPETKALMFGKQANDIDQFMLAAKALTTDKNPSGTAKMIAALGPYGAAGAALFSALTGNPLAVGAVATEMATARAAANLLFTPGIGKSFTATTTSLPGAATTTGIGAASQQRTFPASQLNDFAAAQGMTPQDAQAKLEAQGWRIQ